MYTDCKVGTSWLVLRYLHHYHGYVHVCLSLSHAMELVDIFQVFCILVVANWVLTDCTS